MYTAVQCIYICIIYTPNRTFLSFTFKVSHVGPTTSPSANHQLTRGTSFFTSWIGQRVAHTRLHSGCPRHFSLPDSVSDAFSGRLRSPPTSFPPPFFSSLHPLHVYTSSFSRPFRSPFSGHLLQFSDVGSNERVTLLIDACRSFYYLPRTR